VFGLATPATIIRRTRNGASADGSPILTPTTVWSGKCLVQTIRGEAKYLPTGLTSVATHRIFLPNLKGAAAPLVGDTITAAGVSYAVEYPSLDSQSHHYEVLCRLVLH
jgi:hypothetical protein